MPLSGNCELKIIYPSDSPNEGRVKINENFECIANDFYYQLSGATSAHTIVNSGTNIFVDGVVNFSGASEYTVNLDDDIVLSSVSATTVSASTFVLNGVPINFGSSSYTQITVSAIGDTSYVGTGTPTLSAYTIGDIYLTTFQSGNTSSSGVTIDIDGQGAIAVEKYDYDLSGFTALSAGDIQASVVYYLTPDGSRLQFLETSPDSEPGTYTNPSPIPTTIGGVEAGTVFSNAPYSAVFDDLFYPFLTANFTSFLISGQSTILEKGATIAAGSKTFTWAISNPSFTTPNTVQIKKITGGSTIISSPTSGISNTSPSVITLGSPITYSSTSIQETYRWQILATRTNNVVFSRYFDVFWIWRIYYGTSTGTTLNADGITGLTSSQLDTTIIPQTFAYGTGGYKYLAIPETFSSPTLFKDSNTNLSVAMADVAEGYTAGTGTYKYLNVPITNQYGATNTYRLYRTRNVLGGSINIITS